MNIPKRQHYIAQMLLNRFVDDDGWLHCGRLTDTESHFWKARPNNVFLESHLYTRYQDNGKTDVSVEMDFADLEGSAAPIVDKIVDSALKGREPQLDVNEKDLLLQLLVHQLRRTPERRPYVNEKVSSLTAELPDALEKHVGRPLTPEERDRIDDHIGHPNYRRKAEGNTFSDFAGAKPRGDILKKLRNASIFAGLIRNPKKKFVIGSRPIAGYHEWFPVHQEVAVRLEASAISNELIIIDDISQIRRINEGIVKRSTIFAGSSRKLIEL